MNEPTDVVVTSQWEVDLIESERGWGQKIDSTRRFEAFKEAVEFQQEFNAENDFTKDVPDWYMIADTPRLRVVVCSFGVDPNEFSVEITKRTLESNS